MNTSTLLLILIGELLVLYILSRQVTRLLYQRLHRVTHHKKILMYVFSILLLPGTILHEFSHLMVAKLLFVRTGKIFLLPSPEEQGIRLGSVEIAPVDPFRKLLVGVAPLFVGVGGILIWLWVGMHYRLYFEVWYLVLSAFLMFEIGNTMFLSKSDVQGTWLVLVFLLAALIGSYLVGIHISFPISLDLSLQQVLQQVSTLLFIPILLDLALVLFFKLL